MRLPTAAQPPLRHLLRAALAGLIALGMPLLVAPTAQAHPMPHSVIALRVGDDRATARLELPLDDLTLAMGVNPLGDDEALSESEVGQVADYLGGHFDVTSPDGAGWTTTILGVEAGAAEQTDTGRYQELVVEAVLAPPVGESTRAFTVAYDAIIHQVVTHRILVTVESDWAGGQVDQTRELGVIRIDTGTGRIAPLVVDLGEGSSWTGFTAMAGLGMSHILEGTDHLLFLLVLLLPAPLLARRGRWRRPAPLRQTLRRILAITIAFTLGHSATLAIASLARLQLPTGPIEALIALSILIGAVHALRPLFPGREALIAAGFGLIHGLAFSFTLAELDLTTGQLVLSLLGFNLGIELMQLIVVALVLPPLILASRTAAFSGFRILAAGLTGVAALGWMVDRLGAPNPVAEAADAIVAYQVAVLVAIWVFGLACWLAKVTVSRTSARPRPTPARR
ncbi:MAG: HupE/UreJ family protein [Propionicimonas sp.]|nr:HupE/UreJ family protein [Propionicimonas sp.]